jgi:REP element-mobilizing transposase RayT
MARRPRILIPGAVYHVSDRGNRKGHIFDDDGDRESFMRLVIDIQHRYALRIYALCLMGNHYHAVVETPRGNLSDAMRQLNGEFTQQTNRRHRRTGHLYEGRFSSLVVERESYLRRVVRYVLLNPVEAGLVTSPAAWPWSTYRATVGLEPCPHWLTTDWLPWAFNVPSLEQAQQKFRRYVERPRAKTLTINWNAFSYGTKAFEAAVAEAAKKRQPERRLPRKAIVEIPPPLDVLFVNIESTAHRDRMIELAHVEHGYRLADIARHLGLKSGSAARALQRHSRRKSG